MAITTKGIQLSIIFTSILSLNGCFLAPGMHMDRRQLTATPTASDKAITPKIQIINANLIFKQRQEDLTAQKLAAQNFVAPRGFSTNSENYDYLVGKHDVLGIIVWGHPELNNPTQAATTSNAVPFIVDSNGEIFYPDVGFIKVENKTLGQIHDILTRALSKTIKHPQISVQVNEYKSRHVQVLGAVSHEKIIPITNIPLTIREAITMAGGVNRCGPGGNNGSSNNQGVCADPKDVVLTRGNSQIKLNLDTLKAPNDSSQNYVLIGGDVITVPDNNFSRVFMLGSVRSPGPINLGSEAMSLREAFGDASGVDSNSAPEYTYVIRNYKQLPQIFELDAASPDALNLAGDFLLKPQDIVYVSSSKFSDFNTVLAQLTTPLATYAYTKTLLN